MTPEDYVFLKPLIYQRWLFTADKIERQPELLEIPLKYIEWSQATSDGFAELLAFLRDDREYPRYLKSCSPFPGVLSDEELDQFACAWTH